MAAKKMMSPRVYATLRAQVAADQAAADAYKEWTKTGSVRALRGKPLCVLCGLPRRTLIAGGGTKHGGRVLPLVYVCAECIRLANDLLTVMGTARRRPMRGSTRRTGGT